MPKSSRRILVTGAAQGIGRGVVERLLAEGDDVLCIDRNAEKLADLAGRGVDTMIADLADDGERRRVISTGQGCDGLVNAAGIIKNLPIHEVTLADWREINAINSEAVFFLCQGIGRTMPPGSAIVNLSSSSAKLTSTVETASYAQTKAAVLSITRSFAYALAAIPVRVNAVCPGIIDTPMQDHVLEEVSRLRGMPVDELIRIRRGMVPMGRDGTTAELAGLIHYLLGPDASYMTGQAINFSGGLVMW